MPSIIKRPSHQSTLHWYPIFGQAFSHLPRWTQRPCQKVITPSASSPRCLLRVLHHLSMLTYVERGFLITRALTSFAMVASTSNFRSRRNQRRVSSSSLPFFPTGRSACSFSKRAFTSLTSCQFRNRKSSMIIFVCVNALLHSSILISNVIYEGVFSPKEIHLLVVCGIFHSVEYRLCALLCSCNDCQCAMARFSLLILQAYTETRKAPHSNPRFAKMKILNLCYDLRGVTSDSPKTQLGAYECFQIRSTGFNRS